MEEENEVRGGRERQPYLVEANPAPQVAWQGWDKGII